MTLPRRLTHWPPFRQSRCTTQHMQPTAHTPPRLLPATVELAEICLVPALGDRWRRYRNRAHRVDSVGNASPANDAELTDAVLAALAALPEVAGSTKPYDDLRAVVADPAHGQARDDYLRRLTVSTRNKLLAWAPPRPARSPVDTATLQAATAERVRAHRGRARDAEADTAREAVRRFIQGSPMLTPEARQAHQAARHAAGPVRLLNPDDADDPTTLHGWTGVLIGKWLTLLEEEFEFDPEEWAEYVADFGAPEHVRMPGTRTLRAEAQRQGMDPIRVSDARCLLVPQLDSLAAAPARLRATDSPDLSPSGAL